MATEEESIQIEENPRKRARENSAVQLQEGLSKLCKILQECQTSPTIADKSERNQEVSVPLASAIPKLIEQITILQTAIKDLKTEKEALTQQIHEIKDLKKEIKDLKIEVADLKTEASNQQIQEVEDLKTENAVLNTKVEDLKKEALKQQIHKSQKSVIIRALSQKNPGKESPLQLRNQFEEVLKELKISQNVKITDIYRLKSNESVAKKAKSEFLPTKVEFSSRFEKGLFFSKLKDLKAFKDIRVSSDVPKMLLEQYKELDKRGYEIRTAEPEIKYRISLKGQNLSLFIKKQNEKEF